MSTIVWENLPDGAQPCPQGCGGLTEDPYGGPCRACWDAVPTPGETRSPYEADAAICIGCPGCFTGGRCIEDPSDPDDGWDDDPDDWEPEQVRPVVDVPTRGLL